jgi:hypothetical protein
MATHRRASELLCAANSLVSDYMAVRAGETVIITADSATDPLAIDVLLGAVQLSGARATLLMSPQLPFQGSLADPYVAEPAVLAVQHCDVWLDLCFPYMAGSAACDNAIKRGRVRYLLAGDLGSEGLLRMFGKADLDTLFEFQAAFSAIAEKAVGKRWRVSNAAGSDVTFQLAEPVFRRPRRAQGPGLYGTPGSAVLYPDVESVRGRIVIDSAFHEYYSIFPTPLTLEVDGRIRSVSGGGCERAPMERALRRAGGGDYGQVIHFTYGFNPGARSRPDALIESSRVTGMNAVGLGKPFWVPGGGENHPDGLMSQQSIWIENAQIINDGVPVADELVRVAERLTPLP